MSHSIVARLNKLGIDVIICNEDSAKNCEKLREMGVKGTMTNKALELLAHYR
ncbi:hypothetical protein GOV07_03095 [Candidatus Woesearchaeota archaeon]|nr:hypothetical protein [Candidatus Woesearchaeota archaeon]